MICLWSMFSLGFHLMIFFPCIANICNDVCFLYFLLTRASLVILWLVFVYFLYSVVILAVITSATK